MGFTGAHICNIPLQFYSRTVSHISWMCFTEIHVKTKKNPGTNCHFDLILSNQEHLFIWLRSNYFFHPSGIFMLTCVHSHQFLMIMLTGQVQDPTWLESSDMLIFSCPLCSFIHLSGLFKRSRVTLVTSSCLESILEYFSSNWLSSTTPWILFWNISNYLPGWLVIHQGTRILTAQRILFMKCIHGYLSSSPPVLEYYLTLFGNDSNYLGCPPPPHIPKAPI